MDYQVWTKEEYEELYKLTVCGDLSAARRMIDTAVRAGLKPMLTVEVPYELSIKVGVVGQEAPKSKTKKAPAETIKEEVIESEVTEDQAESDQGTGAESDSQVRRGDETDTKGLD